MFNLALIATTTFAVKLQKDIDWDNVEEIFDHFDTDNSGAITRDEAFGTADRLVRAGEITDYDADTLKAEWNDEMEDGKELTKERLIEEIDVYAEEEGYD